MNIEDLLASKVNNSAVKESVLSFCSDIESNDYYIRAKKDVYEPNEEKLCELARLISELLESSCLEGKIPKRRAAHLDRIIEISNEIDNYIKSRGFDYHYDFAQAYYTYRYMYDDSPLFESYTIIAPFGYYVLKSAELKAYISYLTPEQLKEFEDSFGSYGIILRASLYTVYARYNKHAPIKAIAIIKGIQGMASNASLTDYDIELARGYAAMYDCVLTFKLFLMIEKFNHTRPDRKRDSEAGDLIYDCFLNIENNYGVLNGYLCSVLDGWGAVRGSECDLENVIYSIYKPFNPDGPYLFTEVTFFNYLMEYMVKGSEYYETCKERIIKYFTIFMLLYFRVSFKTIQINKSQLTKIMSE